MNRRAWSQHAQAVLDQSDLLLPDCVLPGCHQPVLISGDVCPACRELWGPYLSRAGETPPWVPSGWVRHDDGWAPPWGVRRHPGEALEARHREADRLRLDRDLDWVGLL